MRYISLFSGIEAASVAWRDLPGFEPVSFCEIDKFPGEWYGVKFFSSLQYAIGEAYERTLRESPAVADSSELLLAECERVKKALVAAVKKAISHADDH